MLISNNIMNLILFIGGNQIDTDMHDKYAGFLGSNVSHFMDQKFKRSSIFNVDTLGYRRNDNPSTSPPTSSRTSSIALT